MRSLRIKLRGSSKSTITITERTEIYEHDLLDRLIKVSKNGTSVAEYTYNDGGLRLKIENGVQEIYYVYNLSGQVIYEQENTTCLEYINVRGNHFAMNTDRVTGYLVHNFLGSTVLVPDVAGYNEITNSVE